MTTLYISVVLIFFDPVLSLKSHFNVTILILAPFEFESIPIEFASILFYSIYSILCYSFLFISSLYYSIRSTIQCLFAWARSDCKSHQCPVSGCPVHGVGHLVISYPNVTSFKSNL